MALKYTRLDNNIGPRTPNPNPWHDITISETTQKRRNQLRNGIDDFASFTWRGIDAFDVFGAFIINNKNSLKFYNGPTYSNSYTKPQFDSAYGQLTGITFNVWKIDFMIGVYWISEPHYRRLINWLNPYEINTLTFGFEPDYFYQVKLASVEDGIRYVVGKETVTNYHYLAENESDFNTYKNNPLNIDKIVVYNGIRYKVRADGVTDILPGVPETDKNETMYYTEMKLSFEVQGPACAYNKWRYEVDDGTQDTHPTEESQSVRSISTTYEFEDIQQAANSDMEIPIEVLIRTKLFGENSSDDNIFFNVILDAQYANNQPITLFDVTFKNQTFSTIAPNSLSIKYESESGLLLLNVGDSEYVLLNQLSTSNYGKRIIDSIVVNHFEIPGLFNDCNFNMLSNLKFKVTIRSNASIEETFILQWLDHVDFNIRARTNLI